MASLTGKELDALLRRHGCRRIGTKGKHEKWQTPDGRSFPVPHTLKGEGTLRAILKFVGAKHPNDKARKSPAAPGSRSGSVRRAQ